MKPDPTLESLLQRMKEAVLDSDTEMAHMDADELLVKAIELLTKEDNTSWGKEFIKEYQTMFKWYA